MKHQILFTESAAKELTYLAKKDQGVSNLLKSKISLLQDIEVSDASKSGKIKLIKGVSGKTTKSLRQKGYNPHIYEYRDFPDKYPFRVFFIVKDTTFIVLMIIHHKEMKSKFEESLENLVNKVIKE